MHPNHLDDTPIFALGTGFEPVMELTFTRLTVWTFRPTKATQEYRARRGTRTPDFTALQAVAFDLSTIRA